MDIDSFTTNCTVCSEHVNVTEFDIYSIFDSEVMKLTSNDLFTHRFHNNYIYPIIWEEECNDEIITNIICSHKCGRKFWHRVRLSSDIDDVDESICKKMRIN